MIRDEVLKEMVHRLTGARPETPPPRLADLRAWWMDFLENVFIPTFLGREHSRWELLGMLRQVNWYMAE